MSYDLHPSCLRLTTADCKIIILMNHNENCAKSLYLGTIDTTLAAVLAILWVVTLIFGITCYLVSFLVIQLRIEKFIYRKIKDVYDSKLNT